MNLIICLFSFRICSSQIVLVLAELFFVGCGTFALEYPVCHCRGFAFVHDRIFLITFVLSFRFQCN